MVRAADPPLDLVLMDVHMPRMDGMSAARAIRALPGPASGLKIVAATASVGTNGIQRCMDAGMNAYVSKPIDPANLFKVIQRLFPDGDGVAGEPALIATDMDAMSAPSDMEMAEAGGTANKLLTGTEPFAPEMLDEMADSMGPDMALDLIDTFLSILPEVEPDLFPAKGAPDPHQVAELAHSLKSAAGSLGLAQVYRAAAAAETAGNEGDAEALEEILSTLRRDLDEGLVWLNVQRDRFAAAMARGG
jgi:CheY-like chemotaxis protein